MQLWTMKLLLSNNFGNKQTEKPTTSLTVSFYVLPLWYRHYLLNYHGLNSHYLECCHHSAWEKRTLKAQAQQIFRWKEMHIIYSLDSPLVLVTWPNSCAEKRGKPDTGEKHKRYRMCVCTLSHVWLSATPGTVAHQAPLFMGFFRQGYWSRLLFPYLTLFSSLVAQMVKNLPAVQEIRVQSLGREYLLEKEMETLSSIPAWEIL